MKTIDGACQWVNEMPAAPSDEAKSKQSPLLPCPEKSTPEKSTFDTQASPSLLPFHEMTQVVSYRRTAEQEKNQHVTADTLQSLYLLDQKLTVLELMGYREIPQRVQVGDMSRADGKRYGPHRGHRDGTEVDMRPATQTESQRAVGDFKTNANYSPEKTRILVDLLTGDPNLERILFNDSSISGVKEAAGHDDHLHLDFKK